MIAVFRKEMRGYRTSMISFVFVAFILAIIGVYFTVYNLNNAYPNFGYVLDSVTFIFLLLVPMMTMRIFAEEKRAKTDQLLFTIPLTIPEIVIGKFLSLAAIYAIPMVIICIYPLVLSRFGAISVPMAYLSILGFFLLGCAQFAIGEFVSSLTESPVIAAVITFGILFVCLMSANLGGMVPQTAIASYLAFAVLVLLAALIIYSMIKHLGIAIAIGAVGEIALLVVYLTRASVFEGLFQKFLGIFDMASHMENFVDGIFDIFGIVYYLSIMVIFLFLTIQSLSKRRWN